MSEWLEHRPNGGQAATLLQRYMCWRALAKAPRMDKVEVRCCEKMWGRILSCGPISNRPSCDIVTAVRGRLKIGLQDEILPHSELGGSTKP